MTEPARRERADIWSMVIAIDNEARRIKQVQKALVLAGIRRAPDPGEVRRGQVLQDAADLLNRLAPYASDISQMLQLPPGDSTTRFRGRR